MWSKVVIDQVLLWERDINRVQSNPSFMYHEFPSIEVFRQAVNFAKSIDMYLWDDGHSRLIAKSEGELCQSSVIPLKVVSLRKACFAGHTRVRDYIISIK